MRRRVQRQLELATDFFRNEKIDVVNTHSSRDNWLANLPRVAVPLVIKARHISAGFARMADRWSIRNCMITCHDQPQHRRNMVRFNGFGSHFGDTDGVYGRFDPFAATIFGLNWVCPLI